MFLAGDHAYKVFKPVRTDLVDFSTLEQCRLGCREEVHANRELAPAISMRVRAIVQGPRSLRLADDGARGAVEYAIEMRRFDDARTMASLAGRGRLTDEHVAAIAQRLATFHARAPRHASPHPFLAVMRASQRNIDELLAEDLACLVMDLERLGDKRAADVLVQCYRDAGGELCSPELLVFYGARHALVRAKVELLRAHQLDEEDATTAVERSAELLRHAERLAWRARGPMVLAIGGPAVSGESPLSRVLHAFEYHARDEGPLRATGQDASAAGAAGGGAIYHAWDELRGLTTVTVRPPAGVEYVVDQIADWLDARHSAFCSPE